MDNLIKNDQGMIQTGKGSFVNPNFISQEGLQQAQSFAGQTPITASSLTPQTPMKLAPTVPATESAGLGAMITSQTDAYQKSLDDKAKLAEANKADSTQSYVNAVLGTQGETALTAKAYSDTVDPAEAELKDINQQIQEEEVSNRRRTEELLKVPGMTTEGARGLTAEYNRQSISKQADLAVIQMAKQGKYDSAKTIADRAVSAQLETQKIKLEALKTMYDDNKDLFTTAEQRQFQTSQADRERKLNAEEKFLTYRATAIVEASKNQDIPTSVLQQAQKAKSETEVAGILSPYMRDPLDVALKKAQIASANRANQGGGGKPLIASQFQALGYGERMLQSSTVIDEVGKEFTGTLSKLTGAGFFPTALKSSNRQRFEQAQRNFVNAVLRRESGAAIAESEFDSAKQQYFPQPGDKEAVLIQKKQNRDMVIKNMLQEAGVDTSPIDASLNNPLGLDIDINSNPLEL